MARLTQPLTLFTLLIGSLGAGMLSANEVTFQSEAKQTALLELFTSEGCSSCPPADAWLSTLQHDPRLWRDFIPVAFHVDYWDRLGWKDTLASPAYSHRQQVYQQQKLTSGVYTPGFVLAGEEWRGWFRGRRSLPVASKTPGILSLSLKGRLVSADFQASESITAPLLLNVAVLGMEIEHAISRGENSQKTLRHDFVVLSHQQLSGQAHHWQTRLPDIAPSGARQFALVGWISHPDNQTPVQATGGWIASLPH